MKELKGAINNFSADIGQLQSLPAGIEQLSRICSAPSHIGPIEFSSALEDLREQAAAAAAEAQELANSFAKATPLQETLDRLATVYQHQHAAIAALDSHLRAYGYTAQCPRRAPSEPLAELHASQQQLAHAAETLPADVRSGYYSGTGGSSSTTAAPGSAAEAVDQTRAPVESAAKTAPPGKTHSTNSADLSLAEPQQARPLADLTNLPAIVNAQRLAKPEASPAAASTSSGTPMSVSPSLRKLQQKYAARPAAADTPPEDLLAMPPRLVAGTPAAGRGATLQQLKQQAVGGIGRWQQQQPGMPWSKQKPVDEPSTQQSQQRQRPTVRFAGVRSMSRSPAGEPAAQQGLAQPDLGRRASIYGQAFISMGGSTAAPAGLQGDAGRRASMYAAVDLAAGADAAVGSPGGWATSAELRSAQLRQAAADEDPALGPVTPAPPPASRSTVTEAETASFAAAGVTELVGVGGNKAGTLMPRPQPPLEQQQQQPLVEEESTMELYSQLIRRRRSPQPQARTPEAQTGHLSFCYTPLTRGAPMAISPDTVSLLSRAFDPTSVSKGKRPNGTAAAPAGSTLVAEVVTLEADVYEEFSGCLPAASVAFARAGAAVAQRHPAPAPVQAPPPADAAPLAAATQTMVAQPAESGEALLKCSCPPPQKQDAAKGKQRTLPKAPEPNPRAAAAMASFAAQKAKQGAQTAAAPAPASSNGSGASPLNAVLITAEEYGGLPAYIRSQIGLEALGAAANAAASAAGGFTSDTLQGAAGSGKAARAAVNCLMKLGRARCEVKGGQMVYHLCT